MKFLHISDLHLGKRLGNISLIPDQKYILEQILKLAAENKPDGVLISGDVYDRSVPPEEAVTLFDAFLSELSSSGNKTFVISGNHDSPERIAFGASLMQKSGVYFSPVYKGEVKPVTLSDEYGNVNIYLLPFIKPVHVRRFFPEEEITDYTSAVKCAVSHMNINTSERNILLAHQFVTGASESGSEDISAGGLDNVDGSVFADFDYVALGHIHGAQNIGSSRIRYCGTPLKYSFSEVKHTKTVTLAELNDKGSLEITELPLVPLYDMNSIKGQFAELMDDEFIKNTDTDAYMHITLTDDEDIPDVFSKLSSAYPNLLRLDYDNCRTRAEASAVTGADINRKTDPVAIFGEFFEDRNGRPMTDEQLEYIRTIWEEYEK